MSEHTRTDWPYPRPEQPPVPKPGDAAHTVNVWLVPNFSMLTLFCLLEPLRVANRFGRELFAWRLLSADGEAVVASNGVRIEVEGALAEHALGDLLMVISSYEAEVSVTGAERAVLRHVAARCGAWWACRRARYRAFHSRPGRVARPASRGAALGERTGLPCGVSAY